MLHHHSVRKNKPARLQSKHGNNNDDAFLNALIIQRHEQKRSFNFVKHFLQMLKAEAVQEVRYQYRSDWKLINRELVPVAFDPT